MQTKFLGITVAWFKVPYLRHICQILLYAVLVLSHDLLDINEGMFLAPKLYGNRLISCFAGILYIFL